MQSIYKDIDNLDCDYWIKANAGCGKTTKLVARFLFLLQNNVLPEDIICITYTNAGANEMKQRILEEIKKDEYYDIRNNVNNLENRIYISTIHGFCKDLLQKKNIINFNTEIVSSKTQKIENITRQIIEKISNTSELSSCIDFIAKTHTLQEFYSLIGSIIENQNNFRYLNKEIFDNIDKDIADIDNELKKNIFPDLISLENFDEKSAYNRIINLLKRQNKDTLIDVYDTINKSKDIINFNETDIYNVKNWRSIVLTSNDKVRKRLVPKEYKKNYDVVNLLHNLQNYFVECNNFYRLQDCLSVLRISYYVIKEYERIKKQNNIITYDDMLFETKKLAIKGELPNIEYLMLDEAQDTNPISWEIISYFKDKKKQPSKLFVVGDIKQSIYGFQGADIRFYEKYHQILKHRNNDINISNRVWLDNVELNISYRSYKGILDFVDDFCNSNVNKDAFCEKDDSNAIKHKTIKEGDAVVQEIEVELENNKEEKNDDIIWVERMHKSVLKQKNIHDNAVVFANKIANIIDNCDKEDCNLKQNKTTTAIIVPKRTSSNGFIYQIIEELRNRINVNIPVELQLNSLLFYDILSILKFSVLQYDDISLCCVLKSKIFNLNDSDILNIRDAKKILWQNLLTYEWKERFKESIVFLKKIINTISIKDIIVEIESICKKCNCFDIYREYISLLAKIYKHYIDNNGNDCDVRSFVSYINEKSYKNDIINDNVISYTANSNHFVYFYTVHGVKGLEFDNVILLDFEEKNKFFNKNELLFFNNSQVENYENSKNNLFFYKKGHILGELEERIDEKVKQKEIMSDREKKRLLYVAITRAKRKFYYHFSKNDKDKHPF